jgi:ABC-type glycerol-3-phosphate transport system permease component
VTQTTIPRKRPTARRWRPALLRRIAIRALAYIILTVGAFVFLIPLAWLISTALGTAEDAMRVPHVWLPWPLHFENFPAALTRQPFHLYLRNTLVVTALGVVGTLLSTSLVAFGFARTRFPGRDLLFVVLLSTMMLPQQVTLIPQYLLFKELNWLNTIKPLTVPAFFGSAFHIFLLRQFFMNLPLELDEAAFMDGANRWSIYWRIVLPLSKPILLTVLTFTFIGTWNDFFGPLLYLSTVDQMTIAVGLVYFRDQFGGPFHHLMAASVMAVIPILIVFFVAQRYFVTSIIMSGLREG